MENRKDRYLLILYLHYINPIVSYIIADNERIWPEKW